MAGKNLSLKGQGTGKRRMDKKLCSSDMNPQPKQILATDVMKCCEIMYIISCI